MEGDIESFGLGYVKFEIAKGAKSMEFRKKGMVRRYEGVAYRPADHQRRGII